MIDLIRNVSSKAVCLHGKKKDGNDARCFAACGRILKHGLPLR